MKDGFFPGIAVGLNSKLSISGPNELGPIPSGSGAWVVGSFTGEVYGHVVSVDGFGEAYVIPIQWPLDEI